jgi:hydrogenase maturation protease
MSLNGDKLKKVLVIGIGNPLRSDDGVGPYIADCIEAKGLSGVKVWVTQQLNIEDLERMLEFNRVILADASLEGPLLDFHPVVKSAGSQLSSSHHLSAEMFVNLASSIYNKELHMHLCSLKGNNFEVGDKISPNVLQRAQEAVELICCSLSQG